MLSTLFFCHAAAGFVSEGAGFLPPAGVPDFGGAFPQKSLALREASGLAGSALFLRISQQNSSLRGFK